MSRRSAKVEGKALKKQSVSAGDTDVKIDRLIPSGITLVKQLIQKRERLSGWQPRIILGTVAARQIVRG
jgi:hypothetical protein